MSMVNNGLEVQLQQLQAILESLPFLDAQAYKPPIIDCSDRHVPNKADSILGLRFFKDTIAREVEVLEQFLARSDHGSDSLSTNASYFVAVWNEIVLAPPPIVAIGKVLDSPNGKKKNAAAAGGRKPGGIKIDVVADEGKRWIRVNTMKNSRILAEFREIDSYLTSSEDEDFDTGEAFDRPTEFDNSLLRMGRALVAASSTTPVVGTDERPSVILRLTRLDPNPLDGNTDPRIAQTINELRAMGIDVELGEWPFQVLHHPTVNHQPSSPVQFQPTCRINMDLSILIALISDLTHTKLPQSEDEAWARFRMPVNARSWKLGKTNGNEASTEGDLSKHSRALSMQCIQEMEQGLIEGVIERLKNLSQGEVYPECWATEEARDRCLQIAEKIGGPDEKRRAEALFPSTPLVDVSRAREAFWRDSRYPPSYLPYFLPIRIHTSGATSIPAQPISPFWGHLIQTCRHILSHDVTPHPKLFRKYGEMERAKVTKANTKLTVHTVESMLVGACAGMTTLTANKASVRAILREMKAVKNGYDAEVVSGAKADSAGGYGGHDDGSVSAAIWIVEPRSLAEGMRVDRL